MLNIFSMVLLCCYVRNKHYMMYCEMAIAELELIFLIYMSLGLSVKFFLSTENFQSPTGKDLKIIDPMGICSSQSTIPGQKCPLPLGHQLIGAHIEYLNSVCKLRIKNQRRCVFCYNSDDRLLWSSSWCHSPECSD